MLSSQQGVLQIYSQNLSLQHAASRISNFLHLPGMIIFCSKGPHHLAVSNSLEKLSVNKLRLKYKLK